MILFASLFVSGCSRKDEVGNPTEVVDLNALSLEEKEKLLNSSGILLRDNPELAHNLSRIETSRGENGIKFEKYFYNNLPSLEFIEIVTFANGQKQIFIHNATGSIKSLSENSLAWLAKASPDEITGEAPAAATAPNKENSSGMTINTLPPIVIKSTPIPESTQKIEEPQKPNEANTKTEEAVNKKDSPNEIKPAPKQGN